MSKEMIEERVKLVDRIKQLRAERKRYFDVEGDGVDVLLADIQDHFDHITVSAYNPNERLREALEPCEYLLLASYCGSDDATCTETRPCDDCLAMCNVFDAGGGFLRELGKRPALSPLPQGEEP